MEKYNIDVIIPVHTATRPIYRAAKSSLINGKARVRVTVIAHNIDPDIIRTNLKELANHSDLRLLSLIDNRPSPSGPMNLGLAEATAPYFSLLGSDDELSAGALDSWLTIAEQTGATTVIARIERDLSGVESLPPTRRGRTRDLHAVKDRLTYRCAPLGLVSRNQFGNLRFTPGLESGEDLEFTAQLWFKGKNIAYDRYGPAYVGHEEESDRVTSAFRSVERDFAHLDAILTSSWFPSLSRSERLSLGVKTLRIHVFDAIAARLDDLISHRESLQKVINKIEGFAPGSISLLSLPDRKTLDLLRIKKLDTQKISSSINERWSGHPKTIMTRNPFLTFHSQAPYRTLRNMTP